MLTSIGTQAAHRVARQQRQWRRFQSLAPPSLSPLCRVAAFFALKELATWKRVMPTTTPLSSANSPLRYFSGMAFGDDDNDAYEWDEQHGYRAEMWENGIVDYLEYLDSTQGYAAAQYYLESETVLKLREYLRKLNLKVSGRKSELIERLLDAYHEYTGKQRPVTNEDTASINEDENEHALHEAEYREDESYTTSAELPEPVEPDDLFCFDVANGYQLVRQSQLNHHLQVPDAAAFTEQTASGEQSTVHEAKSLLDLIPSGMIHDVSDDLLPDLMEIVLDVGKRPFAWVKGERRFLGDKVVTHQQLQEITSPLHFGPDNRAGINGSLHRISAIRNREDQCIGLTLRVGRYVPGNSLMIADVLAGMPNASILLVGDPGSGKTSIVRDAARFLAEEHSVLIVDTSCEIGGSGDIPHECIGLSRRMQVKTIDSQANVMVECVQNHTPGVMVIDEIGREAEVKAALTCKERGVRIVASAHGSLSGLVRNKSLCDLVGGVDVVTVGDTAARKDANRTGQSHNGIASKLKAQRRGPPIFDVVIEVKRGFLHEWHVVLDSAAAVDTILSDGTYSVQARFRENAGASSIKVRQLVKQANALDEIREQGARSDSTLISIPTSHGSLSPSPSSLNPSFDPYTASCTTCPVCNRRFSNRKGFVQHALTKRACTRALPNELLDVLRSEAEVTLPAFHNTLYAKLDG